MENLIGVLEQVWVFIGNNPIKSVTIPPAIGYLVRIAFRSFKSRVKSKDPEVKNYFENKELRKLPTDRLGYSDRMAYLMAELSYLAYFEFELPDGLQLDRFILEPESLSKGKLIELVEKVAVLASSGKGNEDMLRAILKENHFKLLKTFNEGPVQGWICKSVHPDPDQKPFLVTAFRGSEKKVNDWLTNADAQPKELELELELEQKVHGGFYNSYQKINPDLQQVINAHKGMPVYFTGHSLGGAWATLASRFVKASSPTVCYTFGAPKVGNYELFFQVKTPAFRVVNSADIVPRLPPRTILIKPLVWLCSALEQVTTAIPFVSGGFRKAGSWLDRLKHYRHHGDLRYLTDVTDGRFGKTRLLNNVPFEDEQLWFWKGIFAGFYNHPVKSHSMNIYRQKLKHIATERNK
ncbi:MAG: lipase family protein [Bacteroidota bacterium]